MFTTFNKTTLTQLPVLSTYIPHPNMFPFDKILTYIANEQCALVIGPEIMHFDNKPMNMYLRNKLNEQYKDEVEGYYYYAEDGLFQFPPQEQSVKSDVAQSMRTECHRLPLTAGYDEEILKTIAQLPFHLILSINPDTFLSDTFFKYGVTHRFSHYRKGERPSDDVAPPTREAPLIYNIAGSVLEDESLVLDYEDLFSLIGSSLSPSGLPDGLRTALEKIRTFVFIGFNFEKWHTQVMLRILCGKAGYRKFAGPHKVSDNTRVFLANQFKIDFWDTQKGDFLTTFMQNAAQFVDPDPKNASRPFLRTLLENPLLPEETSIIRDIQNAQYARAIASLSNYAKGNLDNEDLATGLSSRYNLLTQKQAQMDSRDYLTTLNQIADAVIQLARSISDSK